MYLKKYKMVKLLNRFFIIIFTLFVIALLLELITIISLSIGFFGNSGSFDDLLRPENAHLYSIPAMFLFSIAILICLNSIHIATPRDKYSDSERYGDRLIIIAAILSAFFLSLTIYIAFAFFNPDTYSGLESGRNVFYYFTYTTVLLKPVSAITLILVCYNLTGPLCRKDISIILKIFLLFSFMWLLISSMELVNIINEHVTQIDSSLFKVITEITKSIMYFVASAAMFIYSERYLKYNRALIKKGEIYNPYL